MSRFVSFNARAEYIETAKAGCTSIKWAMLETDGITPADEFDAHCNRHFELAAADYAPRFRFTFVRHPLARLVSNWREKLQKDLAKRLGGACPLPADAPFADWCRWVADQNPRQCDRHWAPQTECMRRRGFTPKTLTVYKLEHVADVWPALQQRFGFAPLPHCNRTASAGTPDWRSHYNGELLELAERFYADDFEQLNYNRETQGATL